MYTRVFAWTLVALATLSAGVLVATTEILFGPATVSQPAERITSFSQDIVAVYGIGQVDQAHREAADRAARRAGGIAVPARTGASGLAQVRRGANVIHEAPDGYLEPMVYSAIPAAAISTLLGPEVSIGVGPDTVTLNQATAALAGNVRVGDMLELETPYGIRRTVTVGAIASQDLLGGAEIVMTTDLASAFGNTEDTRTLIYGFDSRQAFNDAARATGLENLHETRVSRSWDYADPDGTLSTLETKQKLGVPWYRPTDSGVSMHPDWEAANLMSTPELLNNRIRILARCHIGIEDDLRAALTDVASAGLAGEIDIANTNTYGGCYVPRYSRHSGFLSRHAFGMAIDMNTVTNCQGCIPKLDCKVVHIFRKHGFAWGGNFRRPDGMHFEWVGEPRHKYYYDSNYCPNNVPKPPSDNARTESPTTISPTPTAEPQTIGAEVLVLQQLQD